MSPNQVETEGTINYILIGDVGQTKEAELYKYFSIDYFVLCYKLTTDCCYRGLISFGFILSDYVTVAGSNAYRIGDVQSVRLKYSKDLFKENEIVVSLVVVQQANVTINTVE